VPVDLAARRIILLGALALLLAPLLALGAIGWFSRYAADDYCTAGQLATAGFSGAQLNLYAGWSGRFSATLFITLLESFGVAAVPLFAAVAVTLWLVAAAWAIRSLAAAMSWRLDFLASLIMAALLVYATLQITADMPQDLYWQTGLLTYLSPLLLATLYVGWVARCAATPRTSGRWTLSIGICFALALLAGGTSETFAVAQLAAFALVCPLAWLAGGRPRLVLPLLLAGLAGAVVALAILALAPGNEVRQASASRTPLSVALPQAIDFTWGWLRLTFARPNAVTLALLVAVPAAVLATSTSLHTAPAQRPIVRVAIGAIALLLVVFACMLPAFYALGTNPPGRAQVIPEYVVLAGVGLAGALIGAFGRERLAPLLGRPLVSGVATLVLAGLLVAGPILTTRRTLQQVAAAREYATRWDQLDQQVRGDRERGIQSVTVSHLASTGSVQNLDFVGADPNDWFNQCVARYYAVSSIAAVNS
jgi:hypothetical protein